MATIVVIAATAGTIMAIGATCHSWLLALGITATTDTGLATALGTVGITVTTNAHIFGPRFLR